MGQNCWILSINFWVNKMNVEYTDIINKAKSQVGTEKAKELLEELSISPPFEEPYEATLTELMRMVDLNVSEPVKIFKTLTIIILVFVVFEFLKPVLGKTSIKSAVKYVMLITVAVFFVLPMYKLIISAGAYIKDISVFMGVLAPTAGILIASGGNAAAANAQNTFFSLFLSGSQIVLNVIVPSVLAFMFGLAVIDILSREGKLVTLSLFVKNTLFGVFAFSVSLFYLFISVLSKAASGMDGIFARTLRLMIGNAIPIVGGTVSESLKFVASGMVNVKNTIGVSAVAFVLLMFLPILILLWGGGVLLNLFSFVCDYFSVSELKGILMHIKYTLDFALAAYAVIAISAILNLNAFIGVLPMAVSG